MLPEQRSLQEEKKTKEQEKKNTNRKGECWLARRKAVANF
jgi:hypothetical protein